MENDLVFSKWINEVFTTSQIVARELEVPHKNLLRTITKIIEKQGSGVSGVFSQKFIKTKLKNKMNITFDGYSLNKPAFFKLIMQLWNYEKADIIQNKFIQAFFEMEKALLNHQNTSWKEIRETWKVTRLEFTDEIKLFVEYATKQWSKNTRFVYSNFTKMTYKALELINANKTTPIREYLDTADLWNLRLAEQVAIESINKWIKEELHYKEIYQNAKNDVIKIFNLLPKQKKLY